MIRCIAIDDEPLALKQLVNYITQTPYMELNGQFDSALQAIKFLQSNDTDLMFVDINMPELSGMEFVKSLSHAPKVIFTTAYSEYALEGFQVNALDYLLKPIGYPAFLKSAEKAKDWFEGRERRTTRVEANDEFLFIKSEYKIIRLNIGDITYVEGMREYVRIHMVGQSPVMSLLSMSKLEGFLPSDRFMRVHRSYIVNLGKVTTIERNRIVFDGKVYIPISENYKEKFQEFLNKNFLP